MFRKLIFFSLFWFIALLSHAQIQIEGEVLDSLTQQPLSFATIRVFEGNVTAQPLQVFVTNEQGKFSKTIKAKGHGVLQVSVIGMKTLLRPVDFPTQGKLQLGQLLLQNDTQILDAAKVTAQKILVKVEADKVSYNLESDPDAHSSTLLDMLRKVPKVTVDGQDNITVNGSSNFKIYIDGKPNPMFNQNASLVLKSIPAAYAKKIEVISHPGAKYDAEGTGGVLNIVTQQTAAGGGAADLSGHSLNLQSTVTTRSEYGSAFLTVKQKKFSMSANIMANHQHLNGLTLSNDRRQLTATGDTLRTFMNIGNFSQQQHFYNASLTLSYQFDSLRLLTLSGTGMRFSQRNPSRSEVDMTMGGQQLQHYEQPQWQRNSFASLTGRIDYQRGFRNAKDRLLTLSYQFSTSPDHVRSWSDFVNHSGMVLSSPGNHSDAHTRANEHTAQADFTTPVASGHTVSVGLKYIGRQNHSDSKYYNLQSGNYVLSNPFSVDYNHYNDIGAAYAEYEAQLNPFTASAGLRYEQTWQRVRYAQTPSRNFSLDYSNFVPSATLGWNLNPSTSLSAAYALRLNRPGIDFLNPYVDRTDPTQLKYGNSNLDCEKTHAIDLSYNHFNKQWFYSLTAGYSFLNNGIEQYSFYDSNVFNTTYGNVARNRSFNLQGNLRWQPLLTTAIMLNTSLAYVDLKSSALQASSHGWQETLFLNLQQTMWWKLKLSANLIWNSRSYMLQGTQSGFSGFMGSLTKDFLKEGRLSCGIAGFIPLTGNKLYLKMNTHGPDFSNHTRINVPVAQIGFTVSYRFGKMGLKTEKVRRTIENNDLKENNKSNGANPAGGINMGQF